MSAVQADFTMVPYKGTGPAMNDLVGGQVDFMCDQTTNTVPQIKSGNVKAYGVTTASRIASFPDLPTLDEQGLKGFDLVVWNGLFAPKGTPKPALEKLVAALQTAVQAPLPRAPRRPRRRAGAASKASPPRSVCSSRPRSKSGRRSSRRAACTPIEQPGRYACASRCATR